MNNKTTIENLQYAGRLSSGFKYQVLEFKHDPQDPSRLIVGYPDIDYPDGYRKGKQNPCRMTLEHWIVLDREQVDEWVGDGEEMLGNAEVVVSGSKYAETRTLHNAINLRNYGYDWDREEQVWRKK